MMSTQRKEMIAEAERVVRRIKLNDEDNDRFFDLIQRYIISYGPDEWLNGIRSNYVDWRSKKTRDASNSIERLDLFEKEMYEKEKDLLKDIEEEMGE